VRSVYILIVRTELTAPVGELDVDYEGDYWADHDENCHGLIDTEEMREEYPQGFTWSCCDEAGDEPGCQRGHHQSNPELSKKGTHESESDSTDDSTDVETTEPNDSDSEDGENKDSENEASDE
jgi:hypothetical protein